MHISGCVLCTRVILSGDGLLKEVGKKKKKKNNQENCVVLTPSISPKKKQKKVRNQRDPNQDRKCGLIRCMLVCPARVQDVQTALSGSAQLLAARAPAKRKKTKKNPTQSNTTLAHARRLDYF